MNLYLSQVDQEINEDHSIHYANILKTGLCTVVPNTGSFNKEFGILFRPVDLLTEDTSMLFKNQHYTYQFLNSIVSANADLKLFNTDFTIVKYDEVKQNVVPNNIFVKPNNKIKAFQPVELYKGEKILNLGLKDTDDLELVVTSVKDISKIKEVRCIVFENQLLSLIDTDNEKTQFHSNVYKYALKCIKTIQAVDSTLTGYVLDLAVAQQDTCSIMELNPLETSGFFLSDYSRTLKTISTLLKQKSVE